MIPGASAYNPVLDGHVRMTKFGAILSLAPFQYFVNTAGRDASIAELTTSFLGYVCSSTNDHHVGIVLLLYRLPSGLSRTHEHKWAIPFSFHRQAQVGPHITILLLNTILQKSLCWVGWRLDFCNSLCLACNSR